MSTPPINPFTQLPSSNTPVNTNPTGIQSLSHVVQEAMQISTDEPPRAIPNPTALSSLHLPDEIFLQCFAYLDFRTIAKVCSRVCRQFNQVAGDPYLWKYLLGRDFGVNFRRCSNAKEIYRNFFQRHCRKVDATLPRKTTCIQYLTRIRNHILVGSSDGTVSLFNLLTKHNEPIFSLLSPIIDLHVRGLDIFCGAKTGKIGILDCSKKDAEAIQAFTLFPQGNPLNPIHKMCLFGHRLAIGQTGITSIIDTNKKIVEGYLSHVEGEPHEDPEEVPIISALVMNDRYVCVGFEDGYIEIWDLSNLQKLRNFKAHPEDVSCLRLVGNQLFSSSGSEDSVKIWDPATGNCVKEITEDDNGGISNFHIQGPYIFFDHFNKIKIRHLQTHQCSILSNLTLDEDAIIRNIWTHGPHLMAVTDKQVYLYSFASPETTWEV